MNLSCIIIAKNAEDLIGDCLKSVSFADEIIVVDGGSTDRTNDIAKKFEAKIIQGKNNNFAEQRNIGLHAAKGEWVLYIDTDERLSKELVSSIKYIVSSIKNEFVAFKIKRKNFYFGKHEWPYVEKLERLFKKERLKGWHGSLHESPMIDGEVGEVDGFLVHYTHRDLSSMLEKTIVWSQIEAELRLQHHPKMSWWRFPRVMMTAFYDSYIRQKGYKAGTAGIVESIYQAFSMFVTYARLWELQNKKQELRVKN